MPVDNTTEYFKFKCYKGLKALGLDTKEYLDRLNYELGVIEKMGFASYFLVVNDFMSWARSKGIPTGPGRGSVAGSLVAYCLGITTIDSIKYGLMFERFLNPARISMPDIDSDFCKRRRGEVLEYVKQKYGHSRVAGIQTFGALKSRGAVRAVARTLGADYTTGEMLSKLCLPPVEGKPPSLEKCYEEVPKLAAYRDRPDTLEGKIMKWAEKIEDRIDHVGAHASGYVIANQDLHELIPLTLDRSGNLLSSWDMDNVEKAGLVKFDFLGLKTLTVIAKALELIKERTGEDIDIQRIPLDDEQVFARLQSGDTAAIFQIETSSGIKDLMVKMRPKSMEDLGILVAIWRPGPLGSDYMEQWLRIRAGQDDPSYLVPELKPILSSTDGWLIYQEQVIRICMDLAGFTPAEGDNMRKVVGKKLPEEMKLQKDKFTSGMLKNKFTKQVADKLWDEIEVFAGYGFNKSHAIAYAYLTYQTAWLKTHYPVEHMCAALTCEMSDDRDSVIKYIFNCRELGIKVLPPDINTSKSDFSIDNDGNIRFGMAAIKNLGPEIVDSIILTKGASKFKSITDFINRVDIGKVNKKKLDSLVMAGAFDTTGNTRASMLDAIEQAIEYKKLVKAYESKMDTFHKKLEAHNARNEELKLASIAGVKTRLKPLQNPTRPEEPKPAHIRILPELSEKDILTNEKELLGFYVSGHPIDKYVPLIEADDSLSTIEEIKAEAENSNLIKLIAIPNSVTERIAKSSGKKMASMILEDCTGSINATIFAKSWNEYAILLQAGEPLRFSCRVSLQETDVNTTAELVVMSAETLRNIGISRETIDVSIPLDMYKIGQLNELLKKYNGKDDKVRVSFLGENFEVKTQKVFTIRNRNSFISELSKI